MTTHIQSFSRHFFFALIIIILIAIFMVNLAASQEQEIVPLSPPQKEGGLPLMEALNKRSSTRSYSAKELSEQQISNLLWAAFGVNRADAGKRTAPSSQNQQEIEIYLCTAKGVFLYDAMNHQLKVLLREDIRALTGSQEFVPIAAANLVYIADHSKSRSEDPVVRSKTSYINTGFIAQNVYLYCASEGLGCVVRGWVDKVALAARLNLGANREIIVAQTVGFKQE